MTPRAAIHRLCRVSCLMRTLNTLCASSFELAIIWFPYSVSSFSWWNKRISFPLSWSNAISDIIKVFSRSLSASSCQIWWRMSPSHLFSFCMRKKPAERMSTVMIPIIFIKGWSFALIDSACAMSIPIVAAARISFKKAVRKSSPRQIKILNAPLPCLRYSSCLERSFWTFSSSNNP